MRRADARRIEKTLTAEDAESAEEKHGSLKSLIQQVLAESEETLSYKLLAPLV